MRSSGSIWVWTRPSSRIQAIASLKNFPHIGRDELDTMSNLWLFPSPRGVLTLLVAPGGIYVGDPLVAPRYRKYLHRVKFIVAPSSGGGFLLLCRASRLRGLRMLSKYGMVSLALLLAVDGWPLDRGQLLAL